MQSSFSKIINTKPRNGDGYTGDKVAAKKAKKLRKQQRAVKRDGLPEREGD